MTSGIGSPLREDPFGGPQPTFPSQSIPEFQMPHHRTPIIYPPGSPPSPPGAATGVLCCQSFHDP